MAMYSAAALWLDDDFVQAGYCLSCVGWGGGLLLLVGICWFGTEIVFHAATGNSGFPECLPLLHFGGKRYKTVVVVNQKEVSRTVEWSSIYKAVRNAQ